MFYSATREPPKVNHVKQELQFLRLTDSVEEQILETLKYLHGPVRIFNQLNFVLLKLRILLGI